MRGKDLIGAWLLAAWLALAPGWAWGQEPETPGPGYAPADPQIPIPLGSTRPENGGFFAESQFWYMHQTNPLQQQTVAYRGFMISDNSILGRSPMSFGILTPTRPGTFIGPGTPALDVADLTGQGGYQPGFEIGIGWKFPEGDSIVLSYKRLTENSFRAGATEAPPVNLGQPTDATNNGGNNRDLSNTFLFAPVFNYPPQFNGPQFKVNPVNGTTGVPIGLVSSQAVSGIWNGASIMTEQLIQRYQDWDITFRHPICETDDMRVNVLVGARFVWIWETYRWTTTAFGDDGTGNITADPSDIGVYDTVTSNRMYGPHVGTQWECYLGHGFAVQATLDAAALMDAVHEIAAYQDAAKFLGFPESKFSKRKWTLAGELMGNVGIMWYPWEFIQIQAGYQVMGFVNTLADRKPIDFDFSSAQPQWRSTSRLFDGFNVGLALTF